MLFNVSSFLQLQTFTSQCQQPLRYITLPLRWCSVIAHCPAETEGWYLCGPQGGIPAAWGDASGTHPPLGFQPPCYLAHNQRAHRTHHNRSHHSLCLQTPNKCRGLSLYYGRFGIKTCIFAWCSSEFSKNDINQLETVTGNKEKSWYLCTQSAGLNVAQTGNTIMFQPSFQRSFSTDEVRKYSSNIWDTQVSTLKEHHKRSVHHFTCFTFLY